MSNSNSIQLNVKILKPYTSTEPIRFRRYSVVFSDDLSNIDLTIGPNFQDLGLDTVSTDVIYSQWHWFIDNLYHLTLFAYVGDYPYEIAKQRYEDFLEKLPIAASAIILGDKKFLMAHPQLLDTVILVRFKSIHPEFNKTVPFFKISDFINVNK